MNIPKVSEGLRLNACGRGVRGKEQALSFVHERLRVFALWCSTCKEANSTLAENNPGHDGGTFRWNRPCGLQGHEGSLLKCIRSHAVIAMDAEKPTKERN